MTDSGKQRQQRSGEACPVCGQHSLQLLYFPNVGATGARPYDEIFGFGDVQPDEPPAIGCSSCGSQWASLEDFRAGRQMTTTDATPDADDESDPDDANPERSAGRG
jgi:hypothetical protein